MYSESHVELKMNVRNPEWVGLQFWLSCKLNLGPSAMIYFLSVEGNSMRLENNQEVLRYLQTYYLWTILFKKNWCAIFYYPTTQKCYTDLLNFAIQKIHTFILMLNMIR